MPPWPPPTTRTYGWRVFPQSPRSASRCSFHVVRCFCAPCWTPLGRFGPWFSSKPLSSWRVVSSVHALSSAFSRSSPVPRPTAVSKAIHAVTTPPSSVGSSVVRKPLGSAVSSVAVSIVATPSGFSTVLRFQVNATRSRQKDVAANMPLARSTSRLVSALSNECSHASTRAPGESLASAFTATLGSAVWVIGHSVGRGPPRRGPLMVENTTAAARAGGVARGLQRPPLWAGSPCVHDGGSEVTMTESAVRPGEDPRERARVLSRVRDVVLSGGAPVVAPRSVIEQSWRRMQRTGLDPGAHVEIPLLDAGELQRRREESGLEPLLPILRARLLPAAEAAGQIMVVVDSHGRVLWREGQAGVRRRADVLGFVEGSAWDEKSVGTNAIGRRSSSTHPSTSSRASTGPRVTSRGRAPPPRCTTRSPDGGSAPSTCPGRRTPSTRAPSRSSTPSPGSSSSSCGVKHEEKAERLRAVAAPLLASLDGPALVLTPEGVCVAASHLTPPTRVDLPRGGVPAALSVPSLGEFHASRCPAGGSCGRSSHRRGLPSPSCRRGSSTLGSTPPRSRCAPARGSGRTTSPPARADPRGARAAPAGPDGGRARPGRLRRGRPTGHRAGRAGPDARVLGPVWATSRTGQRHGPGGPAR